MCVLVAALGALSCLEDRQGPQTPSFPSGGLLSVAAPLPVFLSDGTTPTLQGLEGVYDASSRFGANILVHSSLSGNAEELRGSLAILGYDHYGYAIMRAGCLDADERGPGTDHVVFEGYWRFLDDPDPTPAITGLVRLTIQPVEIGRELCMGGSPATPGAVTFVGATGNGQNSPTLPLQLAYVRARKSKQGPEGPRFGVGMHHGACQSADECGVSENSAETLVVAKQLGADYLEVDVHVTADNVPVIFHLGLSPNIVQGIYCVGHVEDYTYAQLLANCRLLNGEVIPRAIDLLEYGLRRTDLPFYLDVKSPDAIVPMSDDIAQLSQQLVVCSGSPPVPPADASPDAKCLFPGSKSVMERAMLNLSSNDFVDAYQQAKQQGRLAPGQRCIVEENPDSALSIPCVAWMPRYTRGPMASDVQRLQSMGKFVGYWTINDPNTMDTFLKRGVPNGILTNYIGLLNQRWDAVGILPPHPLQP